MDIQHTRKRRPQLVVARVLAVCAPVSAVGPPLTQTLTGASVLVDAGLFVNLQ